MKFFPVLILALFGFASVHAASSVVWSTNPPVLGSDAISYTMRNSSDANNVDGGASGSVYLAYNQAQVRGQTFTTGTNAAGYSLSQVALAGANAGSLNTRYDAGAVFTVRVASVSGTNLTVIRSEQYTIQPADNRPASNGVASTSSSAARWLIFTFDTPINLSANTLYGFDWGATTNGTVNSSSATSNQAYLKLSGTSTAAAYAGGYAYSSGSGGFGTNNLVANSGERTFALVLDPIGTTSSITASNMQAVYDEARTPYKYGVVIAQPVNKKVDGGTVFRHNGRWYMIYFQLEPSTVAPGQGYTTQLAVSDNLIDWTLLGTILDRGATGAWDQANAAGGVSMQDTTWGGGYDLETYNGQYWMPYIGGNSFGYESPPENMGIASTTDPTQPALWNKPLSSPILSITGTNTGSDENYRIFKGNIIHDPALTMGAPYLVFYNAQGSGPTDERIFLATSSNMTNWTRYGSPTNSNWVLQNYNPSAGRTVISGDPQIVKMGDLWVMFYFGAFWKSGAFNTFAVSRDLVSWTKWVGTDLMSASETYDALYAHKPWFVKWNGVVYQFYTAVDNSAGQTRTIALATSVPLKPVLTAQVSGNQILVSWLATLSSSLSGYTLESTTNLADTNSWSAVGITPSVVGARQVVTNTISGTARFFRLRNEEALAH